jgi:4,5-DOPA dioxygenase extradiol
MINFGLGDQGFDWAHRYDDAVREVLTTDPGSFGRLVEHPDHRRAVPAPDHWLPMAYVAGMAAAADQPLSVLIDGYFGGSLSMTSYGLAL